MRNNEDMDLDDEDQDDMLYDLNKDLNIDDDKDLYIGLEDKVEEDIDERKRWRKKL